MQGHGLLKKFDRQRIRCVIIFGLNLRIVNGTSGNSILTMIELKNLTKTFYKNGAAVAAVSGVSLVVPEGKIFGIIGASGAGKSTLIRCVNLLEKPTSGKVIVDGCDLLTLPASELYKARRQIGMIFQHFNLLLSQTVFGNVALPLRLANVSKQEIQKRVLALLALVGLEEKQHAYPAHLSGGQKQRVAIARALANNPKVLLCDEATSALDPATTKSILSLLKDINQRLNITILLITHEMEVVKMVCDEVAVLSEGRLIEQGAVGVLFSRPATDTAKQFINASLNVDVPVAYRQRLRTTADAGKHPLVRLRISGGDEDAPALSEAARLFHVDHHIVAARIDAAGGVTFGVMLVEIRGDRSNVEKVIEFFKQKSINAIILGYV